VAARVLWGPRPVIRSPRASRRGDRCPGARDLARLGWPPDPRSDIAEFHLRAGRAEQAAAIWAELKAGDADDVWLYNAAGLSYNEVGNHALAVAWLGEGLELAMRTEDPEGIAAQLSGVRRRGLEALGRELDELEQRVDEFLPHWRARERRRDPLFDLHEALDDAVPPGDAPLPPATAMARRSHSRWRGSRGASTSEPSRVGQIWPCR
jgi:hypothetical protein